MGAYFMGNGILPLMPSVRGQSGHQMREGLGFLHSRIVKHRHVLNNPTTLQIGTTTSVQGNTVLATQACKILLPVISHINYVQKSTWKHSDRVFSRKIGVLGALLKL